MPTSTHLSGNPSSSCKLLIVEDEYIIASDLESLLQDAGYPIVGIASSVAKAHELIARCRPDMVLLDIYLKGDETGIDLAKYLEEVDIPYIYVSANDNQSVLEAVKATRPYGYIVKPFREKDVLTAVEIGWYRHSHSVEIKLKEEKLLQIALTDTLSETGDWGKKMITAAKLLQKHIPFDFLAIRHQCQETPQFFNYYRVGFDEYQLINIEDIYQKKNGASEIRSLMSSGELPAGSLRYQGENFSMLCQQDMYIQLVAKTFKLQAALILSLKIGEDDWFSISFLSRNPETYLLRHHTLLERLEQPMLLTLQRVQAYEQVARLSEKLKQENTYLHEEVKSLSNFKEIIGSSESLKQVFTLVSQVAPTETTVLILGESGTGKELFARAIHNLSSRKDKILVKLNCATLPANLIESELFGHERGAFTGALEKRIGKFELAHGGTIFLDEIGEMPLDLQAKLLRVLQEKEIERVGGNTSIKVNVRVIAATNRILEKEVAEGRFRMDLFFRLATFPLSLPPLRERPGDIPQLAYHFAQKFCKKIGKRFNGIKEATIEELLQYRRAFAI